MLTTYWRLGWIACLGCCCAIAAQSGAALSNLKRIYVEPFAIKNSSHEIRGDVVAQLKKLNAVAVVSDPSAADAILSGDGEIWVKGYRSLNPRSGRLPSDGTPVYGGFLSVDLKDSKGDTLWSYLISPGPTENISKELSKRLEKRLAEVLQPQPAKARP